jgi:hypothetical protein
MAADKIITLDNDSVYERVLPQLQTLSQPLSNLHFNLAQPEMAVPNTGFAFGQQTVENDILDYAR